MQRYFTVGVKFIQARVRVLAYLGGSSLVAIATLTRFFTDRTVFDLVGQQVLTNQWLHGYMSGSNLGITNYLPKMLLFYTPMHYLPGSPRLKLIVLTLAINIVTFVLIGLLLEKLLQHFKLKVGLMFYASLLWLGAIANSVFWLQFSNSRNLEVAGGLLLLYLGLKYLEQTSTKRLILITGFAGIIFFADNLQLYMTAVPLLMYGLITTDRKKSFKPLAALAGAIIGGYVISKLLLLVVGNLFAISFLTANGGGLRASISSISTIGSGLVGVMKGYVHLFAGASFAGKAREGVNLLLFAVVSASFGWAIFKRQFNKRLALLVGLVIVIDSMVYFASGQALQGDTERYLIMTVPIILLAASSLKTSSYNRKYVKCFAGLVSFVFLVNLAGLGAHLGSSWNTNFPADKHLNSAANYQQAHPDTQLYGSMIVGLSLAFYDDSSTQAPLPLACANGRLVKNRTFYDQAVFSYQEKQKYQQAALILDGSSIVNTPYNCPEAAIIKQLGSPIRIDETSDSSLVLVYPTETLKAIPY